ANTFLLDDRLENPVGVIVGSETEEAVSELRNLLTTETPAQETADASTKPEIHQPMESENTKTGSTTVPIKLIAPIAAFILAGAAYALAKRRRART
ncbi:MAG TPA: hypothetical protein VMZ06_15025, partial [Candidatus Bathyarchaeia archaeon]|nr:hypothetical protein [Candidatus Bathyarchaeia archaeon]